MAMICEKCGGVIPDVVYFGRDRNECKNHKQREESIPYKFQDMKRW